jgi:hypothetical protein
MTKNGLDIQTISIKWTDFQTDRVMHLGQLTEKEEKAHPSHFFKISYSQPNKWHIWFCPTHKLTLRKTKRAIFCQSTNENKNVNEKT